MRKLFGRVLFLAALVVFVLGIGLLLDRQALENELVRLHVVANSDSGEDQALKLQVRDAILDSLRQGMADAVDAEQAKAYLQAHLPQLEAVANQALEAAGSAQRAVVTLAKEAFPEREYDTFTLPSGLYESLRIIIGEGEGHNWWCVVFPQLCLPATTEGFQDAATGAGFSRTLTDTLTGEDGYEVRFFLLDALGKLENIFVNGQ